MLLRCALGLSIYAAAVLDTSAPLMPGGVAVHWLALIAVGVVWTMSAAEATLWGALLGLAADSISSGPMGMHVLTFSTLACALAALRQRWECRSLLSLALLALTTAGGLLLAPIAVDCLGRVHAGVRTHVDAAIGSAAATVVVAVLIAAVWRALRSGSIPFHAPARA